MCARRVGALIFGLIFVVAGLAFVFFLARVTELQCTHPEPTQVVCIREVKWLGIVPIGEKTMRDVRGASVDENCDEDGCTYRVIVRTGEGNVPLTDYYSSGYKAKQDTADQITAYAGQSSEGTLDVSEGSVILGVLGGGIFIVAGLAIPFARMRRFG